MRVDILSKTISGEYKYEPISFKFADDCHWMFFGLKLEQYPLVVRCVADIYEIWLKGCGAKHNEFEARLLNDDGTLALMYDPEDNNPIRHKRRKVPRMIISRTVER